MREKLGASYHWYIDFDPCSICWGCLFNLLGCLMISIVSLILQFVGVFNDFNSFSYSMFEAVTLPWLGFLIYLFM
jgi:hypothetical protein